MRILKPLPGTLQMPGHPLADAVGLWLMNSLGNKIYDLSGNGNKGTLVADTQWVPGKFGSALDFDGTGDYVRIPYSPELGFSDDFSISSVIYWNGTTFDWGALVGHQTDSGGAYMGWMIYLIGSDFHFYNRGQIRSTISFNGLSAGWYSVAAVFDNLPGNYFHTYLYLDGILIDDDEISSVYHTVDTTHDLLLGAFYTNGNDDGGVPSQCALLKIDHILLYNRALSASEISQLYRNPFCMFPESRVFAA